MFRDRVLMITMGVSALFHISMVTLFSIYVWVPVNRPKYAQLEIKYLEPGGFALASLNTSLRMPSLDDAFPNRASGGQAQNGLNIEEPDLLTVTLPEISLPSLDSVQLERAEMIASSERVRSEFETDADQDSWAQIIGQIGKLKGRLREFTPLESVFPEAEARERPEPISRPAEGIAMYVEWTGEPADRKLLLGAPIESLWRLNAKSMARPISLPFKVNARGEVVYVLPPPESDEISTSIAEALQQFRFDPLDDPNARSQIGTLVIAPEGEP